ncbi:MAG: VOC family protein [Candidatus Zixiibacteriota bacterium]
MIKGGNATIFVSNMDQAVRFYTDVLGLKLAYRAGDHWAQIDCGDGMNLGLHPRSESAAAPGTSGSIQVGLIVTEAIEKEVAAISQRGGKFNGPIHDDESVRIAFINDPDGNELYLSEIKRD